MAYADISLFQGDDFGYLISLTNQDGTPLNVVGYVFASQAKTSYYTPNVAANLMITATDAINGNCTLSLDSANTANLPAGSYVYDVTMKDTTNTTSRILNGLMIVIAGVTNITPPANGAPAL